MCALPGKAVSEMTYHALSWMINLYSLTHLNRGYGRFVLLIIILGIYLEKFNVVTIEAMPADLHKLILIVP